MIGGCVDAPITPDHLEADGQLRAVPAGQAAFSARDRVVPRQAVQLSAVLAAQAEGALADTNEFSADARSVHLHLRADSVFTPRPVIFRWTHDDVAVEVPGVLAPTTSLSLAASYPIDPELVGPWRVEVLEIPESEDQPAVILFQRDFEVKRPQSP